MPTGDGNAEKEETIILNDPSSYSEEDKQKAEEFKEKANEFFKSNALSIISGNVVICNVFSRTN